MQQRPGELPAEVTGFVGRRRELEMLAQLLQSARLVTVTGPPGVGKTRLALRAAANAVTGAPGGDAQTNNAQTSDAHGRFADGVCLVELGGLRDAELLAHTVAASLGLPEHDARSGVDAVADYLSGRRLLLVLDTCEHVIGGCEELVRVVLNDAPGVKVLATSRQPLDLPGEHVFPVPPLPLPGAGAADGGDAVELFAQRAAAAAPGFAVTPDNLGDVSWLCRRLDGIPLAIELAAVQLRSTSLRALAGSLDHRFLSLTGDGRTDLPHQHTLRAATQWSYDLCSPTEQLLWARLSVFAGSFSIPLAEGICAGDPLDKADIVPALVGLVDKSVVLRAEDDDARYRLLDTIREFGAERLAESGAQAVARDRHIAYFLRKAADFSLHSKDDDQLPRFRELRREHQNIRAALGYALATQGTPGRDQLAARLAADLRPYWEISGLLREGGHWLTKILQRFQVPSTERSWTLLTRGVLATFQGELPEAISDLEASLGIAQDEGDELACALGHAYLCLALVFSGRHAEAARAGAIAGKRLDELDYVSGLVSLDIHLGYMHMLGGEPDLAIERCAQGLRRLGASGERWARGYLQVISATSLFLKGETSASEAAARDALQMKHELGDIVGTAYCLEALAILASAQRRWERTAWLQGAADALWERTGRRLGGNAIIEAMHQQAESAAREALGDKSYEKLFAAVAGRELNATIGLAIADTDKSVPTQRHGSGPLTRREREIAALVAEGLTNAQIARQLVISSRTVDSHVTNIYTKLGISSRVQLAGWLSSPDASRLP